MWNITCPSYFSGLRVLITVNLRVKYNLRKNRTVSKIFDENVCKYPNKPFIIFNDKLWTFKEAQDYANQVANYFYEAGYQKGDVIALFAENCLEYIPLWLGLSKIGVTAALINFNLRDVSLSHCIQVSEWVMCWIIVVWICLMSCRYANCCLDSLVWHG